MPSSSAVRRSVAKKKHSGLTHREVMEKRHEKRRKKEKKNIKTKKMTTLKEYQRLSKIEYVSKKTTAMNIMEIIEEVKDKLTDGSYLQIMDELMALNNEVEGQVENTEQPVRRGDVFQRNRAVYYQVQAVNYFHDRIGNQDNIFRENNTNINRNEINIIRNLNENIIDTSLTGRIFPYNDNWYRTELGTWREREGVERAPEPLATETPSRPDDY